MKILFTLFGILISFLTFSQEKENPWSLQQCIDFALKNNIQIKQNVLNEKLSETTLLQSKAQLLPNLSGNVSHTYNYGKKVDPFTNTFTAGDWALSQNFYLSANVTLFGGFQNLNSIKQNKYNRMAAQQDVLKMQNDVALNIASAYLQILFAQELLDVAHSQSALTQLQEDRTRKLVDVGNLPKGDLYNIESQMAMEEVNVVNAENNLSLSMLNLTQMLNLDTVQNFSIVKPEIKPPAETVLNTTPGQIYSIALTNQPEIKSAEFKLKSAEKGIAISRAGMYPHLSLSASYGTGFSSVSKHVSTMPQFLGFVPNGDITSSGGIIYGPSFSNPIYSTTDFSDQINQNLSRSIGLYLSIPIFNNLLTHTSVSRAKISGTNALLTLQLQKDNLRKTIQQSYNDATAALKKYQASQKAVNAMEESFKYMDQKYSLEAATALEYNDAKNKLTKAKSDLLQAKYDYVFKLKVLDFYQGKPITF